MLGQQNNFNILPPFSDMLSTATDLGMVLDRDTLGNMYEAVSLVPDLTPDTLVMQHLLPLVATGKPIKYKDLLGQNIKTVYESLASTASTRSPWRVPLSRLIVNATERDINLLGDYLKFILKVATTQKEPELYLYEEANKVSTPHMRASTSQSTPF